MQILGGRIHNYSLYLSSTLINLSNKLKDTAIMVFVLPVFSLGFIPGTTGIFWAIGVVITEHRVRSNPCGLWPPNNNKPIEVLVKVFGYCSFPYPTILIYQNRLRKAAPLDSLRSFWAIIRFAIVFLESFEVSHKL